jgi:eukaryotic-like serine/threonine-protein kinase
MGRPPDARLTPEVARDLCQRAGGTATLEGSIAHLGEQYILDVKAVNCHTGDSLAQEQFRVAGKEHVLEAMDKAASTLRAKLGESLASVKEFDTPVEQATTPSLEALQAFSLGWKTMNNKADRASAVPLLKRSITLDPHFAMAYAALGTSYGVLGEGNLSAENIRRAYDLRARVSERERLYIESHYEGFVTGDLGKAGQTYELWRRLYPRDPLPLHLLCSQNLLLGQYDRALTAIREALRLEPNSASDHNLAVVSNFTLNRLHEARSISEEAQAKGLDSPYLRFSLYDLAFLNVDAAGMAQQLAWARGKPGVEDVLLGFEADTAAYSGRLERAQDFSRRAVASAELAEERETATLYQGEVALREALFGNMAEARRQAAAVLARSPGRDMQYAAALALAFAGDTRPAQKVTDDLVKRFPEDTIVQFNYLPTLHAQLALDADDFAKAIEVLQAAAPYELGTPGADAVSPALYPVYVRGEAYLAAQQGGGKAAGEFQKILDHRGIVLNEAIGPLARLQLGRAYELQAESLQGADGDAARAKARAAYQDFLTLWKDADPDIPILKQAEAEYAKLK